MGLDSVELVMRMEETFGITIDDLDAEQIGTVGQAYRYILGRVELSSSAPCRSASQFYRIRRALIAGTGVDRRSLRPSSRLDALLPKPGRREAWRALGDEAAMTLPRLEPTPALGVAAFVLSFVPVAIWVTLCDRSPSWILPAIFAAGVSWIASWIALRLAIQPFATEIPGGCLTIGGLVFATLGQATETAEGVEVAWHPDEVWAVLRDLISEQLGVPKDLVTEEKHFVHDFGMD